MADDDLARGATTGYQIQGLARLCEGEDTVYRGANTLLLYELGDLGELTPIALDEEEVIVRLILRSLLVQLTPDERQEPLLPQV